MHEVHTCVLHVTIISYMATFSNCTVICSDLPSPVNGDIVYSNTIFPRPVGTVSVYICMSGYTLSGGDTKKLRKKVSMLSGKVIKRNNHYVI